MTQQKNTCLLIKLSFILLLYTQQANADCPSESSFLCNFLKDFQAGITPNLPIQLSENLYIRQVIAVDTTLHMYVLLAYDKQHLINEYSQHGLDENDAKAVLKNFAKNHNCSNSFTSKMIKAGGSITSHYQFINGEELVEFTVSRCE